MDEKALRDCMARLGVSQQQMDDWQRFQELLYRSLVDGGRIDPDLTERVKDGIEERRLMK